MFFLPSYFQIGCNLYIFSYCPLKWDTRELLQTGYCCSIFSIGKFSSSLKNGKLNTAALFKFLLATQFQNPLARSQMVSLSAGILVKVFVYAFFSCGLNSRDIFV